jgi:ribonuclease BN (tRNA processing enzyme)
MPASWTVLASGSGGNASLLVIDGSGLLVDIGLGPRRLAARLRAIGFGWESIRGVLLTHTHSDHWNPRSLAKLAELRIPLYCHAEHLRPLNLASDEFQLLQFARLVKTYVPGIAFAPIAKTLSRAIPLAHDGGATFGFRIDSDPNSDPRLWSVGYAADLGSWDASLPRALADVDVLALEFNHDVELQRTSGRVSWLIRRVLGDLGHLSNEQGARLLAECASQSTPGRLKHVIQLHLSRDCNRTDLAAAAAREVILRHRLDVALHTAHQEIPGPTICLAEDADDAGQPFQAKVLPAASVGN